MMVHDETEQRPAVIAPAPAPAPAAAACRRRRVPRITRLLLLQIFLALSTVRFVFLLLDGGGLSYYLDLERYAHVLTSDGSSVSGGFHDTRVTCLGRSDVWPGNRTCHYEHAYLLADGTFITSSGSLSRRRPLATFSDDDGHTLYMHNRWVDLNWTALYASRRAGHGLGKPYDGAVGLWTQFRWSIDRDDYDDERDDDDGGVVANSSRPQPQPQPQHRLRVPSATTARTTTSVGNANEAPCVALLEWFHSNAGHNFFDHMYPSFFSLLAFRPDVALNGTWQWVTRQPVDDNWPLDLLETFSGHPVLSVSDYYLKAKAASAASTKARSGVGESGAPPVAVPCLVAGVGGRGIGVTDRQGVAVVGTLPADDGVGVSDADGVALDPVRAFRDRIYRRYRKPVPVPIGSTRVVNGSSTATSGDDETSRPRRYITVVEQKRELLGAAEHAARASRALRMPVRYVRWEDFAFPDQLDLCSSTSILVVGVGTARSNSFLLPDGAVEVQTCTHAAGNWAQPYNRDCFDAHLGTMASHVRVIHDDVGYTIQDVQLKRASSGLGDVIVRAASLLPVPIPVDRASNLPPEIRYGSGNATEAAPELFWASGGWCHVVPTPEDCPTSYHHCPVTNDRNAISHAGWHGPYGKHCLSPEVVERAQRGVKKGLSGIPTNVTLPAAGS